MDIILINQLIAFASVARVSEVRGCQLLGLMADGHDKVLYCWITEEIEAPACLYEYISLCTEDPKRKDLGDSNWWKEKTGIFTSAMSYLYGVNENGVCAADEMPRNITPELFGKKSEISVIDPVDFGGIGDRVWKWLEENSSGVSWVAQGKITKRFQNKAKAHELAQLLDQWVKEERLEWKKITPQIGRTTTFYRTKKETHAQYAKRVNQKNNINDVPTK